jgi:hypothetical protein
VPIGQNDQSLPQKKENNMLARLIRSLFARCFGLFLLVLALMLILLAPTTGWAQGQGTGTAGGVIPAAAIASGDQPLNGNQAVLIESSEIGPGGAQGLDVAGQPFLSPLVIPAADFRNNGQAPNGYYFAFGYGKIQSQSGTVYLMAPAYLPQNATVNQMSVTFCDNGGAMRPWLNLYRVSKDTGVVDTMASATTASTSVNVQHVSDVSISNPLVVYPTYSYYVGTGLFDASQCIYSVRLYYTGP